MEELLDILNEIDDSIDYENEKARWCPSWKNISILRSTPLR